MTSYAFKVVFDEMEILFFSQVLKEYLQIHGKKNGDKYTADEIDEYIKALSDRLQSNPIQTSGNSIDGFQNPYELKQSLKTFIQLPPLSAYFGYDAYNREERTLCCHLFRLLHEKLNKKPAGPLSKFLKVCHGNNIQFQKAQPELKDLAYENVRIYSEVAIIRDKFKSLDKDGATDFMDRLCEHIMKQENVPSANKYSSLPSPLNNPQDTHPKQILTKAARLQIKLKPEDVILYEALQGVFNAKPDLVISVDNLLLVFEAKYTESFTKKQLERTKKIAELWCNLLYPDLGYAFRPTCVVMTLGPKSVNPDISWEAVFEIARNTYHENDRTYIALKACVDLLNK